jgi:hypothetical protein
MEGVKHKITRDEIPGLKDSKVNNPDLVEGLNLFNCS